MFFKCLQMCEQNFKTLNNLCKNYVHFNFEFPNCFFYIYGLFLTIQLFFSTNHKKDHCMDKTTAPELGIKKDVLFCRVDHSVHTI